MSPLCRNMVAWRAYCKATGFTIGIPSRVVWGFLWGAHHHEHNRRLRGELERFGDIAVPDYGDTASCMCESGATKCHSEKK